MTPPPVLLRCTRHAGVRAATRRSRAVKASPVAPLPTDARRGAHFIRPDLVAHVNFSEWTPDGKLRHLSFQGLREDKPAREVVRQKEKPLSVRRSPATSAHQHSRRSVSHREAACAV